MGVIKILNSFRSVPKDDTGTASIKWGMPVKIRDFVVQVDIASDITDLLFGRFWEFASQADIVSDITDPVFDFFLTNFLVINDAGDVLLINDTNDKLEINDG
jgi:hypothetical protein